MKRVLTFVLNALPLISLITSIICLCGTIYFNHKIKELREDNSYAVEAEYPANPYNIEVKQSGNSFNIPFNSDVRCYEDKELRKEVKCNFKGDESNGK